MSRKGFLPGQGGRPKGARNKLASQVFADILAHWNEPIAEGEQQTKGQEALETMHKDKPHEYVRAVLSVMPKEFAIESFTAGMGVDDIEELMEKIRAVLLEREQPKPELEPANKTAH